MRSSICICLASAYDLAKSWCSSNQIGNAITKKLIAEIAQAAPQQQEGSQKRPGLRN